MTLPFVVTVICYWRIFVHIQLAKQRLLRIQCQAATKTVFVATMKTVRRVKTVFVIFMAFVCCWTPYLVVVLYDASDRLPLPVHLYASMLAHLHASINFAIYGMMNANLRASFTAHFVACCRRIRCVR